MSQTPALKQFGDLRPADFELHPVWVGCHIADYDEPWYDDTDEETFRPWTGALPVDPSAGLFLVRASSTLADGSQLPGFLTPQVADGSAPDLGIIQPHVFSPSGEQFGFWGGIFRPSPEQRQQFYRAIGKTAQGTFPMRCEAVPGLAVGIVCAEVRGFCSRQIGAEVVCEV